MWKNVVILCGAILFASVFAWYGHAFMAKGQYYQIRQVALMTLDCGEIDYPKLREHLGYRGQEVSVEHGPNEPQSFAWAIAEASQGPTISFALPSYLFMILTITFGVLWVKAEAKSKPPAA